MQNQAAVTLCQKQVLRFPRTCLRDVLLSVPRWDDLRGRGGIVRDRVRAEAIRPGCGPLPIKDFPPNPKPHYVEHLDQLGLWPIAEPMAVVGVRNLANNMRVVASRKGAKLLQLWGENAESGQRAYYCLVSFGGRRLEARRLRFDGERVLTLAGEEIQPEWALSGQPLLWDGVFSEDEVLRLTYDIRHFYALGGLNADGLHPDEGTITEEMITLLVETDDVGAVRKRAAELGLRREMNYFHSALGLTSEGDVVMAQLHGSFEDVTGCLRAADCRFAWELDEGGSIATYLAWKPSRATQLDDARLLASHYFRPNASALLVFRLVGQGEPGDIATPVIEDSSLGRTGAGPDA